jgi:Fe-S-cluster-containing dehydrogenase component/formate-dependent nitrite reductase membrane component NrfD
MTTFGFLIDNRKCIGCHACTVACKSEHQVPLGVDRTWVKYIEKGEFPNNRRLFSVMRCNHCEFAPCVTICPVTALYKRDDGVVDFNSDRCIGCKACMQACPYDALYIDPDTDTAAKCNFCTHRLEVSLEPACVVVCPEQAIVCGDLDNPTSKISQLIKRHPVQVRKPEKGTKPKLYYIDGDEASLVPSRTAADNDDGIWSRRSPAKSDGSPAYEQSNGNRDGLTVGRAATGAAVGGAADHGRPGLAAGHSQPPAANVADARRVYDVRPRAPAWGWPVVGYTWTKSIAAGAVLAVAAARIFGDALQAELLSWHMGFVALVFLLITTALLVVDLKQPKRFLFVLLRPQWKSWLVRGAYFLVAYSIVVTVWLGLLTIGATSIANVLLWPAAALAIPTAVYTAFLFAQAKGRDLWQSPLLSVHLLVHALLAGGAVWLMLTRITLSVWQGSTQIGSLPLADIEVARSFTLVLLAISLATLVGEVLTTHPTVDARRAMSMIVGRPFGPWFWLGGVLLGHILPGLLLLTGIEQSLLSPLMILAGIFAIERCWVLAPQRIALS